MMIGTENFITSPVKRAWHFHECYKEKVNWLNFLLLLHNRTPVINVALSSKARECNPCINDKLYKDYVFKIVKAKSRKDSIFDKLLIKQKALCEQCNHLIKWSYLSTAGDSDYELVDTHEIHHILSKAVGGTDNLKNLSLLHKKCHAELHSKQGHLKQTKLLYRTK
jgi:5-methylcytosine-specific restriction endonuclease McrA